MIVARAAALSAADWDDLTARALVPALGAGRAWAGQLLPELDALSIVTAADGNLTGVFALTRSGWRRGRLWPVWRSARSPLIFSGLGLVDAHCATEVFTALINQTDAAALRLDGIPADGPFWHSLAAAAANAGTEPVILKRWQRAALRTGQTFEGWFEANFERKRRKEYRRLRARLGEAGALVTESWQPGAPLDPWIDALLALEAKGWKGRRGTAVAADAAAATALRAALGDLSQTAGLRFWRLLLDGQPLAMMFAMVEGGQAWLGKIAYDEAFAKFSPGVLLILDATAATLADPAIAFADSCAIPGHPMIDHIWRDRLALCSVLIPAPGQPLWKRRAMVATERCHDGARELARNLLNRLRKRLHP